MIYDHGLQKMLEYMQRQMQWQSETLVRLERLLESLDRQCGKMAELLEELQGKPPLTVEYHFDQLKVEKLEGTLNIGLSPAGEQLEQWVVNGETPVAAAPGAQDGLEAAEDGQELDDGGEQSSAPTGGSPEFLYSAVREEVYRYIEERGPKEMDRLEQQYGCITGTELRKFVLSDIRSQVDGRIQYYLAQAADTERSTPEEIRRQTAAKVIRDINTALENYYRKFGEEKEA